VFALLYNVFVVLIGAVIVVNIALLAPIGCRWCIS